MKRKLSYNLIMPIITSVCLVFGLSGCDKHAHTKLGHTNQTLVTAKRTVTSTSLYYSGTLMPITDQPILSPASGRITHLFFRYGQTVKKGQLLTTISSTKLAHDYHQAVSSYLQKKADYESGIQSNHGNNALYKAGVISRDAYTTAKNAFASKQLGFYQAKFQLEKVLKTAHINTSTIEKLSIDDTKRVANILQSKFTSLKVIATSNGIALFPTNSNSTTNNNQNNRLEVGSQIKDNQRLLTIGNLTGFSLNLKVSEVNINRIKNGLPVYITGDAFPGTTLKGVVTNVSSQASPNDDSNSISLFSVTVQIPRVSPALLKTIHVGMTAKVQIIIHNQAHIMLPIKAIFLKNNKPYVTLRDPKTHQLHNKAVLTGQTTLNEIAILKGVAPGDQVVIHHSL